MRFPIINTSGAVGLLHLLLSDTAMAELLGCDAVGCPMGPYRLPQCNVGNATLENIGIANVTTMVDTRPLTWTLGVQEVQRGMNGSNITYDRNFYLGTPPSLQLKDTTGCALFFEGIAASLTSPRETVDNLTCSDVLSGLCVSDLITQAQTALKPGEATNDSDFCNKLRDSLVDKPPSTCNGARGSWGIVVARPLTGDKTLEKIDQTQCHPTTGQGYDLFLVNSQRSEPVSPEYKDLVRVLGAITPVMTLFAKGNDTKAELSCLKLVETKAGMVASTAGRNAPFMAYFALLAVMLVFVV